MIAPEIERHAEKLLQLLLEESISEQEGEELLNIWRQFPNLRQAAEEVFHVDRILRFCVDRTKTLSLNESLTLRQEAYDQAKILVDENPDVLLSNLDLDNLVRLAAESPSLPKSMLEPPSKTPTTTVRKSPPVVCAQKNSRSPFPAAFFFVMLAAFGILIFREWRPIDQDESGISGRPKNTAVVVDSTEVRWVSGTSAPRLGEPLGAESLRFDSGMVELLFFNGTRLAVEGPADISLQSKDRIFCAEGTISATVPETGHGFEIATPFTTIRDLGTKFIVDVSAECSAVHVLHRHNNAIRRHPQLSRCCGHQHRFRAKFRNAENHKRRNVKRRYLQGNRHADRFVMRIGLNSKIRWTDRLNVSTRLQYGYLLGGDVHGIARTQFAAASPTNPVMGLRGVNLGRNQFNVGLGGEWKLTNRTRLFGDYDFDLGDRSTSHTGQFGLVTNW